MINAARHAEASTLRVMINAGTDRLTIDVSDDGIGLQESARRMAWPSSGTVLTVAVAR
jgi:signal transduction histidine kinase